MIMIATIILMITTVAEALRGRVTLDRCHQFDSSAEAHVYIYIYIYIYTYVYIYTYMYIYIYICG